MYIKIAEFFKFQMEKEMYFKFCKCTSSINLFYLTKIAITHKCTIVYLKSWAACFLFDTANYLQLTRHPEF